MKTDREIILENIRRSLSGSRIEVVNDEALDNTINEKLNSITPNDLIKQFKDELEKVNAEFIKLESTEEIISVLQKLFNENNVKHIAVSEDSEVQNIIESIEGIDVIQATELRYPERKNEISKIDAALVFAGNGIADIGSVVFYYDDTKTTYPHFLCDWTVVLLKASTIVANQFELIKGIDKEKAKNMVFVTGPSRTADIEKTLVLGAHGPRRVTVILIP